MAYELGQTLINLFVHFNMQYMIYFLVKTGKQFLSTDLNIAYKARFQKNKNKKIVDFSSKGRGSGWVDFQLKETKK